MWQSCCTGGYNRMFSTFKKQTWQSNTVYRVHTSSDVKAPEQGSLFKRDPPQKAVLPTSLIARAIAAFSTYSNQQRHLALPVCSQELNNFMPPRHKNRKPSQPSLAESYPGPHQLSHTAWKRCWKTLILLAPVGKPRGGQNPRRRAVGSVVLTIDASIYHLRPFWAFWSGGSLAYFVGKLSNPWKSCVYRVNS